MSFWFLQCIPNDMFICKRLFLFNQCIKKIYIPQFYASVYPIIYATKLQYHAKTNKKRQKVLLFESKNKTFYRDVYSFWMKEQMYLISQRPRKMKLNLRRHSQTQHETQTRQDSITDNHMIFCILCINI